MKFTHKSIAAIALAISITTTIGPAKAKAQTKNLPEVNGMPVVVLTRKPTPGATKPEFTSVTVFPGRALLVQQITANFPGKGEVDMLANPLGDLDETAKKLNETDDANGDLSYRFGAALLFPYPNRIRGPLSADGKTLTAEWNGHTVSLPANNMGTKPTAEKHALHGLILKSPVTDLKVVQTANGGSVSGIVHCGDFDGRWFSKTDLVIKITLTADGVDASIVAHNVGSQPEPVAFAWHPYFNIPSGDRTQLRLHIPGSEMAEVDGYDNVFPTGKIIPVAGTRYDFQAPDGKPLAGDFLDDNFTKLEWKGGEAAVKISDPAAKYGVEIDGLSPTIKTVQVYAPPAKSYIAIEHQTNFADPFGKEWAGKNSEMILLAPGKSTNWHVRLKLFVP